MELSKDIPDNFIDLVVTSPPYADTRSYGKGVDIIKPKYFPDWILSLFTEAERFIKPTGSFILNINDRVVNGERSTYVYKTIINILDNTNLKLFDRYIWYKQNGLPTTGNMRLNDRIEYIFHFVKDVKNFKDNMDEVRIPYSPVTINRLKYKVRSSYKVSDDGTTLPSPRVKRKPNPKGTKPTTVFDFLTRGSMRGGKHPAPFHPQLPEFFIKWLTDKNDIVLDPFMGGGTTAEVSIKLGRQFIGFETSKKYITDMITPRIEEAYKWIDNQKSQSVD